jgi:hypothetical protein
MKQFYHRCAVSIHLLHKAGAPVFLFIFFAWSVLIWFKVIESCFFYNFVMGISVAIAIFALGFMTRYRACFCIKLYYYFERKAQGRGT